MATEMPEALHRIRRTFRRMFRRFEHAREDTHPFTAAWTLTVQLTPDELDGGWVAECVELPGCVSQGDTESDALHNLADAISGVIAVRMQSQVDALKNHLDETQGHEHELKISVGA